MTATESWLARLIAEPTVSAAPNRVLVEGLAQVLRETGAEVWVFPDTTGTKAALLARIGPDAPGGLMLSGHIDVVPVDGQDWTIPPFQVTRQADRLYGRGTADMKGFVAAMLALAARVRGLSRPLWLALSYDEEIGCVGVRPMLAEIAARGIRPELVIVGEPTSMRLGLGHKGKLAFTLTAQGVVRHSAEAPLALNALHLAADFMGGVRQLQDDMARNGPFDDGYGVPHATLHVGRLAGGTAVNLVPAAAELLMEARLLATDDPADLTAKLAALAEATLAPHRARFPGAALTLTQTGGYPGLSTAADTPAVRTFAACLPPGSAECRLNFGTEGGLFAEALHVPVVICGPGNMDQGHRPDEFVTTDQLARCDAMLDAAVTRFCAPPV